MRWCCVWMRRARCKLWIALNRGYRCGRDQPNGAPTTINATGPLRFSPHWIGRPARGSARYIGGTVPQSSVSFWTGLKPRYRPAWTSTSLPTTTAPTKTALIRKWFAKRPRFHLHFTPTYGSWINLVERWFAELTNKRIRRGVFRSVKELETAIRDYIAVHNEDPKPFVWTKTADQILDSIARYAQRTLATTC